MQSFIEKPSQIASQGIGPQIINLKDAIKIKEKIQDQLRTLNSKTH